MAYEAYEEILYRNDPLDAPEFDFLMISWLGKSQILVLNCLKILGSGQHTPTQIFSLSISPTLRSKTTRETICKSCRTALIRRKSNPVKGKEERGRKEQNLDNHVADMVAAISSDDYFVRKSINLCLCYTYIATPTATLSAPSFKFPH